MSELKSAIILRRFVAAILVAVVFVSSGARAAAELDVEVRHGAEWSQQGDAGLPAGGPTSAAGDGCVGHLGAHFTASLSVPGIPVLEAGRPLLHPASREPHAGLQPDSLFRPPRVVSGSL